MRHFSAVNYRYFLCLAAFFLAGRLASAQHLLDSRITTSPGRLSLEEALSGLARQGNFYFSYNTATLPTDSLVALPGGSHPVRELLGDILGGGYSFRERGRYIIIRSPGAGGQGDLFRGYVVSKATGARIPEASVYETAQFSSTLSDKDGYFQLRVRGASGPVMLRVSKVSYNDTAYLLEASPDQVVKLEISPVRSVVLDSVIVTPESALERSWIGQLFISSKQKVRDLNLSGFFVRQPFQYSLVPGLGTHGKMSAQVANKFSFNILGGYSGGVNGAEIGGLFNIDKTDVHYVQVAGLFNSVGAGVAGVQVAGLYNGVIDSVKGVQVAGILNQTGGSLQGVQVSGFFNRVRRPSRGIQISGGVNRAPRLKGVQVAGILNRADSAVDVQIAGVLNTVPAVTGLQIGLVNAADTSSGYSIGLVNIIRHGYHQLSVYYTDAMDVNVAYKGGNAKLYTMVVAGASVAEGRKAYGLGFGVGRTSRLSGSLSVRSELSEQSIYTGSWNNLPLLARFSPSLEWQVTPRVACFAGPAFSLIFGDRRPATGYRDPAPAHTMRIASHLRAWFGLQAGFNFF